MEDQGREAAIDVEQDDELDLSLGLRPAPSRRILYLPNPAAAAARDDLSLTMPIWGKGGTRSEQEPDGLGFPELRANTEAQALRRQETRKKRDEKRKSKADPLNNENARSERLLWFENRRALGRESEGDCSGRRCKGRNCNGNGVDAATTSFLVRPPGEFDSNQLNVLPYLMMPGLAVSDGNGFQPVGEFRPSQVVEKNFGHVGGGVCDRLKRSVSSCSRGSSSGGSDYQSTSGQGGSSSDGGNNSSHSHPLDLTIKNCTTTSNSSNSKTDCSFSSYQKQPTQTNQSAYLDQNSEVQTQTSPTKKPMPIQSPRPVTNKPPKPKAHQSNETVLLPQMPCVTTTGNGPNGKRITGFLYKYTKLEVSIVCICHGTSFSPAGFVEHAGGVGIDNPLRHITISPPPAFN